MKILGRKSRARAENDFQAALIKRIHTVLPEAIVLKNDSGYIQGIPDLSILCHDKYAILECKDSKDAPYRPNQEHYLQYFKDQGAYSNTVYPENVHKVLDELVVYYGG